MSAQSDLYRLACAIEQLKSQGWVNAVVADEEWVPDVLCSEYAGVPASLVRKSELQRQYTEQGKQSAPVDFIVTGDSRVVGEVRDARELRYAIRKQHAGWYVLTLMPEATA